MLVRVYRCRQTVNANVTKVRRYVFQESSTLSVRRKRVSLGQSSGRVLFTERRSFIHMQFPKWMGQLSSEGDAGIVLWPFKRTSFNKIEIVEIPGQSS